MRYCTAFGWIRHRGSEAPVLPWMAVKYLALATCCLVAFVALVEWRLGSLAQEGRVSTDLWAQEDSRINRMNYVKIKAAGDHPFWQSSGISPAATKPKGASRILVIGDSFDPGHGYVNANDIWWRQLERELHRRGYWSVEVVAAGFPGASTQHELAWLQAGGLARLGSPDLVILGYVSNDPDMHDANGTPMVLQIGRDIPMRQWPRLDRTIGRVAPNLTAQLRQRLSTKWQASVQNAYPYNEWELRLLEPPNIDAYREVVRELSELVHTSGKPFVAVTLPSWPSRKRFELRYRPIAPIFSAAGLKFHDVLEDFLREFPAGGEILQWGVNPVNSHPGPISTRFYARNVSRLSRT